MIFLCVNTPTKDCGIGAGRAADLTYLEQAVRDIAANATGHTIIVEKSTVPCGTATYISTILAESSDATFDILCNPETFSQGSAIHNLLFPDRVMIGCFNTISGRRAARILKELYAAWVPAERIVTMNINSCELAKVASNALLAQRISSVNALSAMCEKLDADVHEVAYACGLDGRIGPEMLNASVGFGGSCFRKDVQNLSGMAEALDLPEAASYWSSIVDINRCQQHRVVERVVKAMHGTLVGKKIAVMGLSYKKDTADTRGSSAVPVVQNLLAAKAVVTVFDPKVSSEQMQKALDPQDIFKHNLHVGNTPYATARDAQAILLLTEWDMFRSVASVSPSINGAGKSSVNGSETFENHSADNEKSTDNGDAYSANIDEQFGSVDWSRISRLMCAPKYVFDGRNLIRPEHLVPIGFQVEVIGRKTKTVVQEFDHFVPAYH